MSNDVQLARNLKRIGHLDIPGGGQVVVDGDYAFVGHMEPPHGTTIIDISDPAKPKVVATLETPDEYSHTHKVRVVGDLMYTNVEQYNRHYLRQGAVLPEARARLEASLGRPPTDIEAAAEIGVTADDIPALDAANERGYDLGGFRIYDISDKSAPKLITHEKTFGFGVHRFDADENYAYISTEVDGYLGNILVIYDMADPASPSEVARWWMPGQHLAGGETPTWKGYTHRLHHALRVGDELWASVWHAGFRVLDVSDITNPTEVAAHDYHPPIPEPTHTILPLAQTIGGRRIAVAVDEEHSHAPGRLHGFMWVFDVTDYGHIQPPVDLRRERDGQPLEPHSRRPFRGAPVPREAGRHPGLPDLVLGRPQGGGRGRPQPPRRGRPLHPRAPRRFPQPAEQRRGRGRTRAGLSDRP